MPLLPNKMDAVGARSCLLYAVTTTVLILLLSAAMATSSVTCPNQSGNSRIDRTALDEYIERSDPSYAYRVLPRLIPKIPRFWKRPAWMYALSNTYVINMTSQRWLTDDEVDRSLWWHYMTVSIPDTVSREDTALLFIAGGSNTDDSPSLTDPMIRRCAGLAQKLKMVVGTVYQVPNCPIQFKEDSFTSEGSSISIAHTWRRFMGNRTENPDWLMQLPMTKAVVRAMDTITSFANTKINRFYLSGASQRGWLTWTTAAVDRRVVGIVPVVMDMLNLRSSIMHHYRSLGGWSFALEPYWAQDILSWIDNPNICRMVNIIDPLRYASRIDIPKLLVTAGNDQIFLPDDSHYYYRKLRGTTLLRIVPNALHTETGRETTLILPNFIQMLEQEWRLPKMTWQRSKNATHAKIRVYTRIEPIRVDGRVAYTTSGTRRDFRKLKAKRPGNPEPIPQDVHYDIFSVETKTPKTYEATVQIPTIGWACFFVEVQFMAPDNQTMITTTEVHIVPTTFPTKTCNGRECISQLV